jgi:hypothetical protein
MKEENGLKVVMLFQKLDLEQDSKLNDAMLLASN